jgi:hypothetical protein
MTVYIQVIGKEGDELTKVYQKIVSVFSGFPGTHKEPLYIEKLFHDRTARRPDATSEGENHEPL